MNVECQTIRVPTGVQDYRPALYGGIAAIELGVDGVARVAARRRPARARAADRARLHRRAAQLRHEQLGDHQAAHRRRPRTSSTASSGSATRRSRCARRSSAATGTRSAGRSPTEWDNRKRLAPGVTTPAIDDLIARARGGRRDRGQGLRRRRRRLPLLLRPAGARAPRSPRRSPPAARALLDYRIETEGLRRWITPPSRASSREIADLLEIKGENPFKIRAYRNGADIAANHPHELARARRGRPARDSRASARTSRRASARSPRPATPPFHRELLAEFPPTILDLLHLQGVGPEDGRDALPRARRPHARRSRAGRAPTAASARCKGMGAKKEALILKALDERKRHAGRHLLSDDARGGGGARRRTCASARPARDDRRRSAACGAAARRAAISTSSRPARRPSLMDDFVGYPLVERVLGHGDTKSSVLRPGRLPGRPAARRRREPRRRACSTSPARRRTTSRCATARSAAASS